MTLLVIFFTSLWLGILTSISPCPLATNVAAVSFISKNIEKPLKTLIISLFYVLGRAFAYIVVASLVIKGLLSIPIISFFFNGI